MRFFEDDEDEFGLEDVLQVHTRSLHGPDDILSANVMPPDRPNIFTHVVDQSAEMAEKAESSLRYPLYCMQLTFATSDSKGHTV